MMIFSAQSMEIERIYSQLSTQGHRSVAITACNSSEGVSSVTIALAQRYLLAGQSTLVVDLNFYRPSLIPLFPALEHDAPTHLFSAPQLVSTKTELAALTGVAAPKGKEVLVKLRKPGILEECITHWQQHFDMVLFDTSPLNRVNANNLPAERAAAACDAALLVVLARRTTKAQVGEGVARLKAAGTQLTGCLLNDRFNPSLKSELLREIRRFGPSSARWLKKLENIITRNRLLTLDV